MSDPSLAKMSDLGIKLLDACAPVIAQHPGLEVVIVYLVPRPGQAGVQAAACVSNMADMRDRAGMKKVLVTLVHVARDISERLK